MNQPLISDNIIWTLDSYKQLHADMYPEGTTHVMSYGEARSGSQYDYVLFFGLQYIIKRWLEGVRVTKELIDQAEPILKEHFRFNGDVWSRAKWDYIVKEHKGRLPVYISAVPEGLLVPKNNVLFTIINTDSNCHWLTNALETVIQQVWYPIAVATRSKFIVDNIRRYVNETVNDSETWIADFMLHDFGQRGVSCMEQAGIGGMAHLVNSKGTDSDMAIPFAMNYYGAIPSDLCFSVPATEHSIATSLGPEEQYKVTQRVCQLYPTGILSVVSDSYGIEDAVKEYCTGKTRQYIDARDGKFVVRPDSPRWKGDTAAAQVVWVAQQLAQGFGSTVNTKGYKVLNPKIGGIYGDGLSESDILSCLQALKDDGFAASTFVYGQGGGLLQKLNRDTVDFAIKCCAQTREGTTYDIYKKPMGGSKISKCGRMKLVWAEEAGRKVMRTVNVEDERDSLLVPVFRNGELLVDHKFNEVRSLAASYDSYRAIH